MKLHTTLLLLVVLSVTAATACSNEVELNPAEEELVGVLLTQGGVDGATQSLLLEFPRVDYTNIKACPVLVGDVSFEGATLREPDIDKGGYFDDSWNRRDRCDPVSAFVEIEPKPDGGDGSFVIAGDAGRAEWTGVNVFATRTVETLTPLDDVAPGAALRFRLSPEGLALTEAVARSSFWFDGDRDASIDADGVVTVIVPFNMRAGTYAFELCTRAVLENAKCDGFASCLVESVHNERIAFTVAE